MLTLILWFTSAALAGDPCEYKRDTANDLIDGSDTARDAAIAAANDAADAAREAERLRSIYEDARRTTALYRMGSPVAMEKAEESRDAGYAWQAADSRAAAATDRAGRAMAAFEKARRAAERATGTYEACKASAP